MKVKNVLPSEAIAGHVDRILIIEKEVSDAAFVLPLYANGVPTLLYKSVKGKLGNANCSHLTLFGQTLLPESLTLNDTFTLIAYFFKPHSLISLFGMAGNELTDNPMDLRLLTPQRSIPLQEKLLNCDSVERMIHYLDQYIYRLVGTSTDVSSPVKYASEQLSRHYSKESLERIQKELGISERTFERMFEKYIGVSPNSYRRIRQFNSAFVDLNLRNYSRLSDIAFDHGYSDQSHYIRTFKRFTGITPMEYLNFGTK